MELLNVVALAFGAFMYVMDTIVDKIEANKLFTLLVVTWLIIFYGEHLHNKRATRTDQRLAAIEAKLRIEYEPPEEKEFTWVEGLGFFILSLYVLGDLLRAEEPLSLYRWIIFTVSSLILLTCVFRGYVLVHTAVRGRWRAGYRPWWWKYIIKVKT